MTFISTIHEIKISYTDKFTLNVLERLLPSDTSLGPSLNPRLSAPLRLIVSGMSIMDLLDL